jgi:hypothetical protein
MTENRTSTRRAPEFRAISARSYVDPNCPVHGTRTTGRAAAKPSVVHTTETPDPYSAVAPRAPQPTDDPNYRPHGTPPDGYAIALTRKETTR